MQQLAGILAEKVSIGDKYSDGQVEFKDIEPGQYFLQFGFNGQLWRKSTEEPNKAFFVKNVGKKTAAKGTNTYIKLNKSTLYTGERFTDSHTVYPIENPKNIPID